MEGVHLKNEYTIQGENVHIFLQRRDGTRVVTIISACDLEKVQSYKGTWVPSYKKNADRFYVVGNIRKSNGKKSTIQMHRFLLDCDDRYVVDHINHDSLDNRRENLRCISHDKNIQNRSGANKNSGTGIRGISFDKRRNQWQVRFKKDYKTIHYGRFDDLDDAIIVAAKAIKELFPYAN